MPTHSTISPVEAATKAVDALLTALDGNHSPGAAAAYRSAITRHGRQLVATAGSEAIAAVVARIRTYATDRSQAEERERALRKAWGGDLGSQDEAA